MQPLPAREAQQGSGAQEECLLSYSVFVMPQAWLPVRLIQGRIEGEVVKNLEAVRDYAEHIKA
jgi:hypothetical protein